MAFNIHITQVQDHTNASRLPSKVENHKQKRAASAKTSIFAPTLVSVPADNVINKYPVRIFNIES
ncbi:MAG: hypothetical protein ABI690_04595 [Chloroflexota bacterium]